MGQKTHPTGFRIGIIEPWLALGLLEENNMLLILQKMLKSEDLLKRNFMQPVFPGIVIARKAQNVNITVVTAKPGIVVGRGGQGIDELRSAVQNLINNKKRFNRRCRSCKN